MNWRNLAVCLTAFPVFARSAGAELVGTGFEYNDLGRVSSRNCLAVDDAIVDAEIHRSLRENKYSQPSSGAGCSI